MLNIMRDPSWVSRLTIVPGGYTDGTKLNDGGRGAWAAANTYFMNEYVRYAPTALYYRCKNDNVTSVCTNTTDWEQGNYSSQAYGYSTHSISGFQNAQTCSMTYTVTLPYPITTSGIAATGLSNWGEGGPGGGENNPSGSAFVQIWDAAHPTGVKVQTWGYLGNSPVNWQETVPRIGVTQIKLSTSGTGNGGDWWSRAGATLTELGIFVGGTDDYGFIA